MVLVVCPAVEGDEMPAAVAAVLDSAVVLPPPGDAPWIPHTALGLRAIDGSVSLLAYGSACALIPHLGFAARAARRPVSAYVLVEGPLPDASHRVADWPDAPVTVVCGPTSEAARAAALRGWRVASEVPVDAEDY